MNDYVDNYPDTVRAPGRGGDRVAGNGVARRVYGACTSVKWVGDERRTNAGSRLAGG